MPVAVPEHDSVLVDELTSTMVAGLTVHVSPLDPETIAASETVPVKESTDVAVIVDVPMLPFGTETAVGVAASTKSVTLTSTVDECVSVPFVPVTVTW